MSLEADRPEGGINIRSSFHSDKFTDGELAGTDFGVYLLDLDAFHDASFTKARLETIFDGLHDEIKNTYNLHVMRTLKGQEY